MPVFVMIIPELDLEIAIASREGAERLTASQPGRWNVISIRGLGEIPAKLQAKEVVRLIFDDVVSDNQSSGIIVPRREHARTILEAARRFVGEPVLVHCMAGVSRSPAAALGIIYWHALRAKVAEPVDASIEWLIQMGDVYPNSRLARYLVELVESFEMPPPRQSNSFNKFRSHPKWPKKPAELDFYSRFLPQPIRG